MTSLPPLQYADCGGCSHWRHHHVSLVYWLVSVNRLFITLVPPYRGSFYLEDCNRENEETPPFKFTPRLFFIFLLPPYVISPPPPPSPFSLLYPLSLSLSLPLFLSPPPPPLSIVLEAGYFLNNRAFFENLPTILVYAVVV